MAAVNGMNELLNGKLALVTGGGRGIGQSICITFARAGATVVAADINLDGAQETLSLISDENNSKRKEEHFAISMDVTKSFSVDHLLIQIFKRYSRPADVVVNCAGIGGPKVLMVDFPEDDFDNVMNVNLKGTFLVSKAAIKRMLDAKITDGAIVNIASISGKAGHFLRSVYAASKAGIVALTKTMAEELATSGIRCNAVLPGMIRAPMFTSNNTSADEENVLSVIPMKRIGEPEEVANVCLFLASHLSSYMTGASLEVTGGKHM